MILVSEDSIDNFGPSGFEKIVRQCTPFLLPFLRSTAAAITIVLSPIQRRNAGLNDQISLVSEVGPGAERNLTPPAYSL